MGVSGDDARVATKEGPVGPYPPSVDASDPASCDAYDRLRRRVLWAMPQGLYIVGSTDGAERRNGMVLNWVTQLSFDPKLVGIGVEHGALTHELIGATGVFSVCFVHRDDRAIMRKFTKPVDVDLAASTLNGFPFVQRVTGAPILTQSVAYLDCRVVERPDFGHASSGGHTFFVGEIVDADFLQAEDSPVLRMEDTRMNYGG
jgi:flavin reductase (DIM6/NTAB) family NADH-FMN oxidoreductase RutF